MTMQNQYKYNGWAMLIGFVMFLVGIIEVVYNVIFSNYSMLFVWAVVMFVAPMVINIGRKRKDVVGIGRMPGGAYAVLSSCHKCGTPTPGLVNGQPTCNNCAKELLR